jgi:hypothetical protein
MKGFSMCLADTLKLFACLADLTLVSQVYGLHELQSYLQEHHPEHPLCAFRQSVEAGQTRGSSEDQLLAGPAALDLEARVQAIVAASIRQTLEVALPQMLQASLDQQRAFLWLLPSFSMTSGSLKQVTSSGVPSLNVVAAGRA